MPIYLGKVVDNQPQANWKAIYAECKKHKDKGFIVEVREYDLDKELSYKQIRWWKGVLLKALARDTGEPESKCEAVLKLTVMPDEFQPIKVKVGENEYTFIPSITKLSTKKMSKLMMESVQKLQEWGFTWATEPDPSLRA